MDKIIRENRAVFINFLSFDLSNGLLTIRYSYNMTMYRIITKIISYIQLGIERFITNQQNIYRVTPVHYLQKAEKKTREKQYNIERERRK